MLKLINCNVRSDAAQMNCRRAPQDRTFKCANSSITRLDILKNTINNQIQTMFLNKMKIQFSKGFVKIENY